MSYLFMPGGLEPGCRTGLSPGRTSFLSSCWFMLNMKGRDFGPRLSFLMSRFLRLRQCVSPGSQTT